MSLLLDALNRASQDKAAAAVAAAASANAAATVPKPSETANDVGEPAPAATPAPSPLTPTSAPLDLPGLDWPTLGLALAPVDITPAAAPTTGPMEARGTIKPLDSELKLVAEPAPKPPMPAPVTMQPPQLPGPPERRIEPPLTFATPLKPQQPAAPSSSRPLPKDAPRVAQSIIRAKATGPKSARPTRLIALLSVAVLLACGLGSVMLGWWGDPMTWLQSAAVTSPAASPIAMATAAAPTATIETTPAPAAAPKPVPTGAEVAPARTPGRTPDALRPPPRPSTAVMSADADRVSARCAAGQSPSECEAANLPRRAAAPSKTIEPMLQSRGAGPSTLESAYAALTQGRLTEARQAYTQALAGNPQDRDALLGLAYIAHSQGRTEEARSYYHLVLRQDPGNAVARAGLLTLSPTEDAQELGSQSRDVAEQNPGSAAAQSVLGHSLARQGLLAQAQLAFQRAQLLEPTVALHAFNLAVAQDRLRRYPLARHYYEQALSLSTQTGGERGGGVPLGVVQERLIQLQAAAVSAAPRP